LVEVMKCPKKAKLVAHIRLLLPPWRCSH
jgi:hypothetical protein